MFSPQPADPELLVTIPVYNERGRIAETVTSLQHSLPTVGIPYRLSISEDGSTDGTPAVIEGLQRDYPELLTSSDPEKRGRGYALRTLWISVKADIYAFTDADLPAGTEALAQVIAAVRNGADVATGSRYAPGARLRRPPLRSFISRIYNWLIRTSFRDGIYDHQCGIKAFSRTAVETLLPLSKEDSWFWDTEVLVLAKNAGLRIEEVPVVWSERKYKLTSVRRLLSDVLLHGSGFVRLVGRVAREGPGPLRTPQPVLD
jgi:glycosyltransferase involved in cell wall biosynthesis